MRGIQISEVGGPAVLKLVNDLPKPVVKDGHVLVKNHFSGINFIDIYHRTGLYPLQLPAVLGREASGVVEEVGEGVTHVKAGDRVAFFSAGSYAEYTLADATTTALLPSKVSFEVGACFSVGALTALVLATKTYKVKDSDAVLIHAAAGGVGQLLAQICKRYLKARLVIGTTSSQEKAEIARSCGCDHVLNYSDPSVDVVREVMKLTDDKGCSVVYDGVGKSTFDTSLACTATQGLIASFGNASGKPEPFDLGRLAKGSKYVTRMTLMDNLAVYQSLAEQALQLIADGIIQIDVSKIYSLEDVAQAHEDLNSRNTTGKIILKI